MVPPPRTSAATISEFRRDGFAVIAGVTTREDLGRITRILARLYRRYRGLTHSRHALDLGLGTAHGSPEILEINHTAELEPELTTTLTFERCGPCAGQMTRGGVRSRRIEGR
jgi:hypothetical protein